MPNTKQLLDEAFLYLTTHQESLESLFQASDRPDSEQYKLLLAYYVNLKLRAELRNPVCSMSIKDICEKNTVYHKYIHLWYSTYGKETSTDKNAHKHLKYYIRPRQGKYAIHFTDTTITETDPLGFKYEIIENLIELNTELNTEMTIGKLGETLFVRVPEREFRSLGDEAAANFCLASGNMECFNLIKSKKSIRRHLRANAARIFNQLESCEIKENILAMYIALTDQKIDVHNNNTIKLYITLGVSLEDLMTNLNVSKTLNNSIVDNELIDFI